MPQGRVFSGRSTLRLCRHLQVTFVLPPWHMSTYGSIAPQVLQQGAKNLWREGVHPAAHPSSHACESGTVLVSHACESGTDLGRGARGPTLIRGMGVRRSGAAGRRTRALRALGQRRPPAAPALLASRGIRFGPRQFRPAGARGPSPLHTDVPREPTPGHTDVRKGVCHSACNLPARWGRHGICTKLM